MKIIYLIVSLFLSLSTYAQAINRELKIELEQILKKDQELRELFKDKTTGIRKKEILKSYKINQKEFDKKKWEIVKEQDSLNLLKIAKIIHEYGYPGKSMVGEPTNLAAWYVIQHSTKISTYFHVIKEAGEAGEIPMPRVAMMEDRMFMYEGKEQIYGTQIAGRKLKDTGEWLHFIWPVKKPKKVDELRKKSGFQTTLEESVKSIGLEYKLYTLKEINKITIKN